MSEPVARRTLTREEARRVYDRIGARQDSQAFYEDRSTNELVRRADLASASAIFEVRTFEASSSKHTVSCAPAVCCVLRACRPEPA